MNRADVVAAAVEHLLPTSRLLLFGELASAGAACQELSTVLSSYRPSDLVTGAGRFRSDDVAISGIGSSGDWIWQVTWEDLARALTAVLTAERVEDLASAYRASLSGSDAGRERLAATRSILAHDLIEATGLIPPSLFRDALAERVIVDPADSDTPVPGAGHAPPGRRAAGHLPGERSGDAHPQRCR